MRKHLIITFVFLGLALPLGQACADDHFEARKLAAEQGDAYAQHDLGVWYQF